LALTCHNVGVKQEVILRDLMVDGCKKTQEAQLLLR